MLDTNSSVRYLCITEKYTCWIPLLYMLKPKNTGKRVRYGKLKASTYLDHSTEPAFQVIDSGEQAVLINDVCVNIFAIMKSLKILSSRVGTCEPSYFHSMQGPKHRTPRHTRARTLLPQYRGLDCSG